MNDPLGDLAAAPPCRATEVIAPDGVRLAVREWGAPHGRPVLFIHGYSQSGLCWQRQVESAALAHLRLVTFDLRGHGASDKPLDPAHYKADTRWSGDIAALIAQLGLERPVLVGWSYGGRVIGDYLRHHGEDALAALVFVDGVVATERQLFGTCNNLMRLMGSDDPATQIAATRAFLRKCFEVQPDPDSFEIALASNMMTPPQVRAAMSGRPADYGPELAAITRPVLVVHGLKDQVIHPDMSQRILQHVPHAQFAPFPQCGHAPFLEAPEAFNAELGRFIADLSTSVR
ncbi:alpha/beta hydrolase [Xanthobacter sp. DSM 24535]|uniref:alpha/beta fold hydrolase n=1 Tax=Roseixanthobacter psychrophilus TaxID=3119917 RepID=UPI003728BDF2